MLRSTFIILILALSASASAEDFDYSYLTLGYANTDFDALSADGDGFTLGGSFAFSNSVHGFASYEMADLGSSAFVGSVDATRANAGVGYNTSTSDKLDLLARLSYEYIDLDGGAGNVNGDDSGFGFGVGLRYAASDKLELNAGINYVDYGDLDDTSLEVGGLYDFTNNFSLGLAAETSDEITSISISGRFYFGH